MLRSLMNIRIVLWMCIKSPLRAYYLKALCDPGIVSRRRILPLPNNALTRLSSNIFAFMLLFVVCISTASSQCTTTSINCNDFDCTTVDSVDPQTCECVYTDRECDDGECFTEDWFNPVTCECIFEIIDCDDNNCRTADGFDEVTCTCQHIEITCNDNKCYTDDFFNPQTCECENTPVVCDDNDCLTEDTFHEASCTCLHTPIEIDCDDNDCATTDQINPQTCACENIPIDCNDFNCTTDDSFDPNTCDCVHIQNAIPDCDDGDCSTKDRFDPLTCDCINSSEGTQLICNDELIVSVDANCAAEILVDALFEGEFEEEFFEYAIIDEDGVEIDVADVSDYIGQTLFYNIINTCNNQTCWGNIVFNDNLAPTPNCPCEDPYMEDGTVKPECSFSCYQIWDLEVLELDFRTSNNVLPEILEPTDNCGTFSDPEIFIVINETDSCHTYEVQRTAIFTYPNYNGGTESVSCTETYIFEEIDYLDYGETGITGSGTWDSNLTYDEAANNAPESDWYWPQEQVELPCGHDTSPESIEDFYNIDTPYAPNNNNNPPGAQFDDRSQTENIEENNEGIPFAFPYVVVLGYDGLYHPKAIDANLCNLFAGYEDVEVEACGEECPGNLKVLRKWTVLDWCNQEVVTYDQVIFATDNTGPVVEQDDITVSTDLWDCLADIEFPTPEHLYDDCYKGDIEWTITGSGLTSGIVIEDNIAYDVPKGKHTFYYNAFDCCGNVTIEPIGVTVIDQVAPVAIAKENIIISLTFLQNPDGSNGIAKVLASDIDNFSTDNCTDVHLEIRRESDLCGIIGNDTYNNDDHPNDDPLDSDNGEFVTFCCEDLTEIDEVNDITYGEVKVWLRVWDDGDMNGVFGTKGDNFNEVWSIVRVEDKLKPAVKCPDHIIISCEASEFDYSIVGKPEVLSTCVDLDCFDEGNEPVDRPRVKPANTAPFQGTAYPAFNQNCGYGAIERTWRCGDRMCSQWIIKEPQESDTLTIFWPEDEDVTCLDGSEYRPNIRGKQCELLGINLESDTFNFDDEVCFRIINTWSIIDWCQYDINDTDLNSTIDEEDDGITPGFYTHSQVINMRDFDPPELMVSDTCYAVDPNTCESGIVELKAIGTDNGMCGSSFLDWNVEVDLWGDDTNDWVYSSSFPASSDFYISQTAGSGSFVSPTASDEQVCVVLLPEAIASNCGVEHVINWTVSDGCGNFTSGESLFTVVDKKKPTPYCVNLSTAVMENGRIELSAINFDAGSFDNCSEEEALRFTFSDTPPEDDSRFDESMRSSNKIFDCSSIEESLNYGGILPVEIYVWDECGNYDFCIINLKLIDNSGNCGLSGTRMISGLVKTENGEGVPDVQMTLNDSYWNNEVDEMTDDNGNYVFTNNALDVDYTIKGTKDVDWLNGVSTLDLVIIQQYILGFNSFDSPYKMIAADVNNDNRVSSIDLIELRKLILDIVSTIEDNESWRIIFEDQELEQENPWPFTELREIETLEENMLAENFIGVKIGDVNNTVILDFNNQPIGSRESKSISFEDTVLSKNDEIVLAIGSDNLEDIYGMQMAFSMNGIDILDVLPGTMDINESNFSITDDHLLLSWNNHSGIQADGKALFSIRLKASEENIRISEALILDDDILNAEIYQGAQLSIYDVHLENKEVLNFALLQNEPNPWQSETFVSFELPKEMTATLKFFSSDGRLIKRIDDNYSKGLHKIRIKKSDFAHEYGVIYYELTGDEISLTQKMIMID